MEHDHIPIDPGATEWVSVTAGGRFPVFVSQKRVYLWALVLESRYIPGRVVHNGVIWRLLVPADQLAAAQEELHRFEEENLHWPPVAPSGRLPEGNTLATLSVLILLATFHNLTLIETVPFVNLSADWAELGSAKAHLIKYGEWWRLVTALTLHADGLHLISNLTIGGFFVISLCRELGSGLAWSLLLAAGTLGNLANAYSQLPTHNSVGASTAVFAAVGVLAAVNLVRHRKNRKKQWQLIVAAALALLAILGTEGRNTDLGAHLFGFLFGGALGLVTELLLAGKERPGRILNVLLALASGLVVIGAWWAALVHAE